MTTTTTPSGEGSKPAQVTGPSNYNSYFKMLDPLHSLPVFTETLELGAAQWIQAGRGYLQNAGIAETDYIQHLVEKIEPRAIASYKSYLETKSIMGAININQLEEFLLTWNGNISTGAEYSMQLEQLQYTGGPIVKFNHEFSTLVNHNNLDPNDSDTIFCYINKFVRKPYVHTCLIEAKFDKLQDAMERAISIVSTLNTSTSITTHSTAIVHSGPKDMDVDRMAFSHGIQAADRPFLPKFEKFSHFCGRDEFLKHLDNNQCIVCAGTSHRSYRVCPILTCIN
ncbi:hypothetical protein H4S07_000485 [Coemansia furcata]|uniref:Uncharacterized protein n=1 Tax=Coemansia furcata TaxID=417177 RepID=A0ACC1LS51_9FUNG|nr:hypothetical protein H4S07_000485 [Coemansia furcata]